MEALVLLGIQEEANLLSGTLDIKSRPGQGTSFVVESPVASLLGESSLAKIK